MMQFNILVLMMISAVLSSRLGSLDDLAKSRHMVDLAKSRHLNNLAKSKHLADFNKTLDKIKLIPSAAQVATNAKISLQQGIDKHYTPLINYLKQTLKNVKVRGVDLDIVLALVGKPTGYKKEKWDDGTYHVFTFNKSVVKGEFTIFVPINREKENVEVTMNIIEPKEYQFHRDLSLNYNDIYNVLVDGNLQEVIDNVLVDGNLQEGIDKYYTPITNFLKQNYKNVKVDGVDLDIVLALVGKPTGYQTQVVSGTDMKHVITFNKSVAKGTVTIIVPASPEGENIEVTVQVTQPEEYQMEKHYSINYDDIYNALENLESKETDDIVEVINKAGEKLLGNKMISTDLAKVINKSGDLDTLIKNAGEIISSTGITN